MLFKVAMAPTVRSYFYSDNGRPKFPFYCTSDLYRCKDKMSKGSL